MTVKQKQTVYIDTNDSVGGALWQAIEALSDKQPFLREVLCIGFLAKNAGFKNDNGQLVQYQKLSSTEHSVAVVKPTEHIVEKEVAGDILTSKVTELPKSVEMNPNSIPADFLSNLQGLAGIGAR